MAGGAVSVWNVFAELGGSLRLPWQWGSAGQDHGDFSVLQVVFPAYQFLSPKPCMNHQTLHSSPCGCVPGQRVDEQHVSQYFECTGIYFCATESRVVGGQGGVCGEARVMERTSCALGGNSYWIWLQFVPWQPGSLASCFSCAESPACSCSHCILQDCIIFFFLTKELPAGVVDHTPSSRHKGQHTLYTTLLLFPILF